MDQTSLAFSQLTIWNAQELIRKQTKKIREIMGAVGENWVVNVVCISERKNYILTSSEKYDNYFKRLLELKADGSWLESDRLYLRKEIIEKMKANEI